MSWCVWLLPSPLILATYGLKERKIRWLVLQSWGQSTDSGLGLLFEAAVSQPFCCSYWPDPSPLPQPRPQLCCMKFANPEYITVSGKATSFLSYSWHWDLPLFSSCPQNNYGTLLSSKIAKRNKKKSNLLKVMQPLCFSLLPFLVLTSYWITTRGGAVKWILSNKSLSEYKKFKLKITLKERRLFLMI